MQGGRHGGRRRAAIGTLTLTGLLLVSACSASAPSPAETSSPGPTTSSSPATMTPTTAGTSSAYSGRDVDDPASATVVVNKARPLDPVDWAPTDLRTVDGQDVELRAQAADAAERLLAAAAADGHRLRGISGYRSYAYQQRTHAGWVEVLGAAEADRVSARAGRSEHQTGLAWDVGDEAHPECDLDRCLGDLDSGRWIAAHAAEHGFIVRYPEGAETVTGFAHEPWHLRWVGVDVAAEVRSAGGVLESAWGLPAAPAYPDTPDV